MHQSISIIVNSSVSSTHYLSLQHSIILPADISKSISKR